MGGWLGRVGRVVRTRWRKLTRPAVVQIGGVRLRTTGPAITPTIAKYLYKGAYEAQERRIIGESLRADDVVLDVGGGLGFIAAFCARRCRGVTVVEANPDLCPVIRDTLALNGLAGEVVNAVLAPGDGTATFHVARDFWASSLCPVPDTVRTVEVPALAASALMARVRPTYLVMDIEGGEAELLPHIPLDGVRCLCVEIHPEATGQEAMDKALASVTARGFHRDETLSQPQQILFRRSAAS